MFRLSVWVRVVVALLLAMMIVAGGYGLYRLGFTQGYQAGAIAIQPGNQGNPAPQIPYYGYPWRGYYPFIGFPFFFPFFGPFLGIGFFFLFFFLIRALFGFGWWGGRRVYTPDQRENPGNPQSGTGQPGQ